MNTVQPHDPITRNDLQDLAAVNEDVCVSLYMPAHPSAPESRQDPVRLRNLLDEAEERLLQHGMKRPEAEKFLQPCREMVRDDHFWTHQSEGLAIFLTRDSLLRFRLPAPFEQCIEVANQFLVTPLVSLLRPGHAFFVLAVSQNSCRLFRGTQFQIEEIESADLPTDLESALGRWRERELRFHSHAPRGGAPQLIFHGHEDDSQTEVDLAAYLRQVAEPLQSMLYNQSAPLLFAGVEEVFAVFRKVYDGTGLIDERIAGNPDRLSAKQLHELAWPIVERHNQSQFQKTWEEFHAAKNIERATQGLETILPASRDGLVDTLLIADGTRHLVTFDADAQAVRRDGQDGHLMDILNLAAVQALRTNAQVLAVPPTAIPEKASAAAILRGPVSTIQPTSIKS